MPDHSVAERYLCEADPVLAEIISRHGQCKLKPVRRFFISLVEAILSQQLSVKAAATIFLRFKKILNGRITADAILSLSDVQFRATGVSRQKMGYLRDLAEKWRNGQINRRRFKRMSDEEVITALTQVKGIGRWTAEMFLIFSLCRPDVLPVGDLGFRTALKRAYRMRKLPESERITALAECWRPYRAIATWYFWASLDNKPMTEGVKGEA